MIPEALMTLAAANLAAAGAVAAVLVVRGPVRTRFGARAAYALWLAPLVATLAAAVPHQASGGATAPVVLALTASAERLLPAQAIAPSSPWPALLLGVWLIGAVAAAGVLVSRQAAFLRSLGRLEPRGDGVLRAEAAGVGPALVGALRPRIVTPADFEARFAPPEQALVLAHERVHLETGDALVNALAAICQCLGWFNPLVHLGARRLRADQELACDATVIGRFPAHRRLYAELLLKTQLGAQPLPFGCLWPSGSEHPLKERIVMLNSSLPKPAMRAAGRRLVSAPYAAFEYAGSRRRRSTGVRASRFARPSGLMTTTAMAMATSTSPAATA